MFRKLSVRLAPFALAVTALIVLAASVSADSGCRKVKGRYQERAVAPTCGSMTIPPLCIEGEFSGDVKGMFASTATALQSYTDTLTTTVVWFTGDGVIHARIDDRAGDVFFKSSGAYQTTGAGNIVDLQYITGGTGQLAGISGVMRASGTFVAGMGQSEYEGTICLP